VRLIDSGFLVGNGLMGGHKMLKFGGGGAGWGGDVHGEYTFDTLEFDIRHCI
jgi:hypothetical protein